MMKIYIEGHIYIYIKLKPLNHKLIIILIGQTFSPIIIKFRLGHVTWKRGGCSHAHREGGWARKQESRTPSRQGPSSLLICSLPLSRSLLRISVLFLLVSLSRPSDPHIYPAVSPTTAASSVPPRIPSPLSLSLSRSRGGDGPWCTSTSSPPPPHATILPLSSSR